MAKGRPRTVNWDKKKGLTIYMEAVQLEQLRKMYNEAVKKSGVYKNGGGKYSLNDFLLEKLLA